MLESAVPTFETNDLLANPVENAVASPVSPAKPSQMLPARSTVVGLTCVALILRVLMAARGGLWRDEALFLFVARSPSWSAMLDFLRFHESHPPLFYGLMRAWLSITGDTDAMALVLPVAFGVALIPVIYLVGASLFSRRAGLIAACLATFSPSLIEYSAIVRPYSLLPLLVLISSFTLVRAVETGSTRMWVGYVASTVAMLYTHNWVWLVLCGQWVAVAVVIGRGIARPRRSIAREWLLVQSIIGLSYVPWAPSLIYQTRNAGHAPLSVDGLTGAIAMILASFVAVVQTTVLAFRSPETATNQTVATIWFMVLAPFIIGVVLLLRTRKRPAVATAQNRVESVRPNGVRVPLIVLVVVPTFTWLAALILSRRSNMLLGRCFVMLAPSLLLVIAYWLIDRRSKKRVAFSGVVVLVLVLTYLWSTNSILHTTRSNAREMAANISLRTQSTDLVIIAPEWLASSFNRYYRPSVEQIDYPHFGREGAVDFAGIRGRLIDPEAFRLIKARIGNARRAGRRVWLATDSAYVQDLSADEVVTGLRSPKFGVVGIVRTNQIRAELESVYGPPATTFVGRGRPTQLERFTVFLFSPR